MRELKNCHFVILIISIMLKSSNSLKVLSDSVLGRFAKEVQDTSLPWISGRVLTTSEMTKLYTSNKRSVCFPFPSIESLRNLYDAAQPSSSAKGSETVLDTNYGSARTLTTKEFALNIKPEPFLLNQIKEFILKNFEPDDYIRAKPYQVNIYGPGDSCNEHRDTTQTASGHFGSLMLCLPTKFEGGALVLRNAANAEEEVKFDWGASFAPMERKRKHDGDALTESGEEESVVEFAAFASDLVHLIEPVTAGYRVTVTYHLFLEKLKKEKFLKPVIAQYETRDIQREMVELMKSKKLSGKKVLFPLAHQYSSRKASDVVLKGGDAALFQMLQELKLKPKIMFFYDDDGSIDEFEVEEDDEEEDYVESKSDEETEEAYKVKKVFLTDEVVPTSDRAANAYLGYEEKLTMEELASVYEVIWAREPSLPSVLLSVGAFYGNEVAAIPYYGNACILTKL